MSRSSAQAGNLVAVGKTSSIFDVDQVRILKPHHEGNSTTSFSYDPSHHDDKNMMSTVKRAIFEPTYRLEPLIKVQAHAVKEIIETVLEQHLAGRNDDIF